MVQIFQCNWLDFHLSSFNGVVITLPVLPVHTVSKRRVFALKIAAVQVGVVTVFVPPGSLELRGTILNIYVVVSIFGAERHATVERKRVTSSSLKKHTTKEKYDVKNVSKNRALTRIRHIEIKSVLWLKILKT